MIVSKIHSNLEFRLRTGFSLYLRQFYRRLSLRQFSFFTTFFLVFSSYGFDFGILNTDSTNTSLNKLSMEFPLACRNVSFAIWDVL
ncbi:hypothetical protein LEP1GSC168_0854 [Leptospira santarosai str. HAI134]|nr:hypothetical protein LEP1GSC168_0854 [Leptospira santarosai str. HAI134]